MFLSCVCESYVEAATVVRAVAASAKDGYDYVIQYGVPFYRLSYSLPRKYTPRLSGKLGKRSGRASSA